MVTLASASTRNVWTRYQKICLVGSHYFSLSRYVNDSFQGSQGSYNCLQEPLYLPSKCELQVSIWRLTNQRQVWYEWCAEAFLSLPSASPLVSLTPPLREARSLKPPVRMSTPNIEASPFIDNVEVPPLTPASHDSRFDEAASEKGHLVKIGQTSLHNPHGRSSWIGL